MIEAEFILNNIDPVLLYGINNSKLEIIAKAFPKLKIVARGQLLKVYGKTGEIENFKLKFDLLLEHLDKYNSLTVNSLESILLSKGKGLDTQVVEANPVLIFGSEGKAIRARTPHQQEMVKKSETNDLIFAIGPAGTGKTYIAIALAVMALKNKQIRRIILSRPAVEAGERLGFLPGNLSDKLDPYLQPLYDALKDMIPARKLNSLMEEGVIQIAPLAYMRGRTLANAFVILDEAQNSTTQQLKMFLTRMGENAKFVVTGDITQIDLARKKDSGLLQANRIFKNISGIATIEFDVQDIIRHQLVKDIVDAYNKAD